MEKSKAHAYQPTGNEFISIPELRESDAALMGVAFLHMGFKGLIEINGSREIPFLRPLISIDGAEFPLENIVWRRMDYWIPTFTGKCGGMDVEGMILTPQGERGFICRMKVTNPSDHIRDLQFGYRGFWQETLHTINVSKPVAARKRVYQNSWFQSPVFDLTGAVNFFSFAIMCDSNEAPSAEVTVDFDQPHEEEIHFQALRKVSLGFREEATFSLYWGFGFEEIAAATSALEMIRKGFDKVLEQTRRWLMKRAIAHEDPVIREIMNLNLFFNFFFAAGLTLDTEEFVLVTSRSHRYYVSAAYWDRDSLLWSFPAILIADRVYAREMLDYVFTRQMKNPGIHSRYIDGTVLEPGFELDELCAPLIALAGYVEGTGDLAILQEAHILKGVSKILTLLDTKKHPESDLYETFLQPSDDVASHPYLTYDNVLVWKALHEMVELYRGILDSVLIGELKRMADSIEKAIWEHCVVEHQGRKIFAWSVDLQGNWRLYDEPPGSLQLLPFYGFCLPSDPVYQNTVAEIRNPDNPLSFQNCPIAEIGCEHAPHPWILSVANSLLCGRKEESRELLQKITMDHGIACESVDEVTGECATGEAFATCAGFLAFVLYYAFCRETGR
jgi:hypothetical protein